MLTPSWRKIGSEPDYRFSLANERTFLAWIRTALALVAGGVLLQQFATKLQPHALLVVLAVGLTTMSGLLSALAYFRWKHNEIAMRRSRPLPNSVVVPLLAVLTTFVAIVIAWVVG